MFVGRNGVTLDMAARRPGGPEPWRRRDLSTRCRHRMINELSENCTMQTQGRRLLARAHMAGGVALHPLLPRSVWRRGPVGLCLAFSRPCQRCAGRCRVLPCPVAHKLVTGR